MTRLIRSLSDTPAALTYPEHGSTLQGPLPRGYAHLHLTVPVGAGQDVFETAGEIGRASCRERV